MLSRSPVASFLPHERYLVSSSSLDRLLPGERLGGLGERLGTTQSSFGEMQDGPQEQDFHKMEHGGHTFVSGRHFGGYSEASTTGGSTAASIRGGVDAVRRFSIAGSGNASSSVLSADLDSGVSIGSCSAVMALLVVTVDGEFDVTFANMDEGAAAFIQQQGMRIPWSIR